VYTTYQRKCEEQTRGGGEGPARVVVKKTPRRKCITFPLKKKKKKKKNIVVPKPRPGGDVPKMISGACHALSVPGRFSHGTATINAQGEKEGVMRVTQDKRVLLYLEGGLTLKNGYVLGLLVCCCGVGGVCVGGGEGGGGGGGGGGAGGVGCVGVGGGGELVVVGGGGGGGGGRWGGGGGGGGGVGGGPLCRRWFPQVRQLF